MDDRLTIKEKLAMAFAMIVFAVGMFVYLDVLHGRDMQLLEMDFETITEENTSLEWSE